MDQKKIDRINELAHKAKADGPCHRKHDGDEDPRADVAVFFWWLRLPEAVVIVVFVCHQDLNPFPCSFRLLPFSSTI